MRGLAILIMVEAHVVDAWTRPADRSMFAFACATILGGFAAPLFLFLAGVAVVLAAGAKARVSDVRTAARAVQRRGWQIFGLAFLFRLQALVVNASRDFAGLLKVDILNVMGPAIVGAAAIWGAVRSPRARVLLYAAAAIVVALATPWIRATPLLGALPDPLEWYMRPAPSRTAFTLFPWAGFVFAGACLAVLLDAARARQRMAVAHGWLIAGGASLAAGSYAASYLPSPFAGSRFWTTSPAFFFLRVGILAAAVGAAFFAGRVADRLAPARPVPMQRFGRSSLFVYWIHVEMVYGWMSTPFHRSLPLTSIPAAWTALVVFLFGLVAIKERVVAARRRRAEPAVAARA